jgi:hypothetical protein
MDEPERPDPDEILARVKREESATTRGKLKIFFGMSPGVGKTYAMLRTAQQQQRMIAEIKGRKFWKIVFDTDAMPAQPYCARRGSSLFGLQSFLRLATPLLATGLLASCKPGDSVLERSVEAKRLAGELRVLVTQAAAASNLALMATKEEEANSFSRDAAEKARRMEATATALRPILTQLSLGKELDLLGKFEQNLAAYRQLEREIIDLAVENTNLKAQRLSVGAVHEAAEAFRSAAEALASTDSAEQRVLVLTAVAALREIEVLEAPHIVEARDEEMARLESAMRESEQSARRSLEALIAEAPAEKASSRSAAEAALDRFFELHAQVIALSRRNSNVRSLALALGQKLVLTARCEEDLRALSEALNKHRFVATR